MGGWPPRKPRQFSPDFAGFGALMSTGSKAIGNSAGYGTVAVPVSRRNGEPCSRDKPPVDS